MIPLVNKPMHARFSFHHSSLQLSFITQAWILKLVLCKQSYEMHIQMHHTSLWACSPYLCAQNFNWSLSFVISLPYFKFSPITYIFISLPLCCLFNWYLYFSPPLLSFHYLCTLFSPPLSSMTTKVQRVGNTICRVEIINVNQWGEDHFPKFGSN